MNGSRKAKKKRRLFGKPSVREQLLESKADAFFAREKSFSKPWTRRGKINRYLELLPASERQRVTQEVERKILESRKSVDRRAMLKIRELENKAKQLEKRKKKFAEKQLKSRRKIEKLENQAMQAKMDLHETKKKINEVEKQLAKRGKGPAETRQLLEEKMKLAKDLKEEKEWSKQLNEAFNAEMDKNKDLRTDLSGVVKKLEDMEGIVRSLQQENKSSHRILEENERLKEELKNLKETEQGLLSIMFTADEGNLKKRDIEKIEIGKKLKEVREKKKKILDKISKKMKGKKEKRREEFRIPEEEIRKNYEERIANEVHLENLSTREEVIDAVDREIDYKANEYSQGSWVKKEDYKKNSLEQAIERFGSDNKNIRRLRTQTHELAKALRKGEINFEDARQMFIDLADKNRKKHIYELDSKNIIDLGKEDSRGTFSFSPKDVEKVKQGAKIKTTSQIRKADKSARALKKVVDERGKYVEPRSVINEELRNIEFELENKMFEDAGFDIDKTNDRLWDLRKSGEIDEKTWLEFNEKLGDLAEDFRVSKERDIQRFEKQMELSANVSDNVFRRESIEAAQIEDQIESILKRGNEIEKEFVTKELAANLKNLNLLEKRIISNEVKTPVSKIMEILNKTETQLKKARKNQFKKYEAEFKKEQEL